MGIIDIIFDKDPGKATFITFVAPGESGKSYCIRYILSEAFHKGRLEYGLVMSNSLFNGDFDFFDQNYCFQGWNPDALKQLMEIQESFKRNGETPPPAVLVLDDMLKLVPWEEKWVANFVANHRHWNITIMIACQLITKGSSTLVREQTRFAFIWPLVSRLAYKSCNEAFTSDMTLKDFHAKLQDIGETKHACLLVNCRETSKTRRYRKYLAPGSFKIPKLSFE